MDSPKAAEDKAADLSQAALSADLRELSDNPMMLTTMAIIHQRDVGLPKQRVRLYKLAVEVLVRRWQLGKTGERGISPDPALADLLKDDRRMRRILERLAYAAHLGGKGSKAAVDLTRGQAIEILEDPLYLGDAGLAARFLEYIDQRAGLLVGRGGESRRPTTYSFPHRTFQEYLAGCYLAGERDAARRLIEHAGEAETWNLAAELGAEELYYNGAARGENDVLDLAYDLWRSSRLDTPTKRRSALWAGKMVALVGRAAVERDMAKDGPAFLERVGPGLASLLGSDLTAAERADAGRLLGALGDPRFDPQRFHLPAEPLLGFVPIPAGPFLMGSNKDDRYSFDDERPQHEVTLPAYYLGRYPVTNAQFAQFASHGGYAVQRFWPEAQKAGRWKDGQYIDPDFYGGALRTAPFDYGQPFNLPNHPVVGASWYEALAYCRWLGEALKALSSQQLAQDGLNSHEQAFWQGLAEGSLVIGLPCEAEWEKAARGPLPSPGAVSGVRAYPWGDVFDPDKANCYETGLGATSAAGCFPLGASPYGLLDLSGNVWEWTRSLRGIIPTLPAWKSG
jgi:formylglycine-generating enzyme required for sulfatase activity